MRLINFTVLFTVFCIVSACGLKGEKISAPPANEIAFSVNDVDVTVQDTMIAFQESMDFSRFYVPDRIEEASKVVNSLNQLTAFQKYLAEKAMEEGLDQEAEYIDYRNNIIEEELAQRIVVDEVLSTINVTKEEVESFYEENLETLFLMKDSNFYEIRGIYTLKQEHPEGEAERLIREAYQKLEDGLRFESVAKDYSDAPSYMRGDVNRFSARSFPQETLMVLEELDNGDYSEVLDLEDRFMILKREDYTPPEYASLENSRKLIITQLKQQKIERSMFQLMERLKQKHNVLINEDLIFQETVEDPSIILLNIPGVKEISPAEFQALASENNLLSDQAKEDFFNQLVFQSLCLAEAYSRGWTEEEVAATVEYWCERELSKSFILSNLGKATRENLESIYEEKKGDQSLMTPKYIDYSHLFFRIPNLSQSTRYEQQLYYQTAQYKAMQALEDLKKGLSFEEVIALHETSDSNAVRGERVGRVPFKSLSPAIQNNIKQLKEGETSEPKRISNISKNRFGIELFHIHEIKEPEPLPKEQALVVIAQQLAQQRFEEKKQEFQQEFFQPESISINHNVIDQMAQYLIYLHEHPVEQVDIAKYLYGELNS